MIPKLLFGKKLMDNGAKLRNTLLILLQVKIRHLNIIYNMKLYHIINKKMFYILIEKWLMTLIKIIHIINYS